MDHDRPRKTSIWKGSWNTRNHLCDPGGSFTMFLKQPAKTQVFIMELRFFFFSFLSWVWNIPKGKLAGACYSAIFLIELRAFFFFFFLLNIWVLFSNFVFHKFTWSYLCFIQFLWFNIHTLMSRLFLSHICHKPYFSFLAYVLSSWITILSQISLCCNLL